jgi:two-component sensor histidine kinase
MAMIRVLIVDDSEDDALLIIRKLKNEGHESEFKRVDTASAMRAALESGTWDTIICDYVMPSFSAPDALNILKESGRDLPFIVVSGVMGEETAVAMMKAGAHDYIKKDALARLAPAVEREIKEAVVRAERRKAEEALRASLREKDVLLKEVHHRVKNNMQVISSLLSLQSRYIKDEAAAEVFREGRSRIRSMSLVHEMMYRSKDMARINFDDYIRELATQLFRFYGISETRIRMITDVEGVSFGLDIAVPCGLILNELLSNALKHAFPDDRNGEVRITLQTMGEEISLSVADNGVGLPEGIDFRNTESLGLQLVINLARQLVGEVSLDRTGGTKFMITFSKEK